MPSLEMLKKLLDEFTEKEAHAREEINVINEQIVELEKRIAASQAKLSTVAVDREKVRAMQARYSGDSTLTTGPLMGGAASTATAEKKEESPRPRPGRAAASEPGIPVAPLNLRASQTRIPAMKLPETPAEATPAAASSSTVSTPPATTTPSETSTSLPAMSPTTSLSASPLASLFAEEVTQAVSPSSPFSEEPATPAASESKFSPLDIFGTPTDEIPTSTGSSPAAAESTASNSTSSNSFPFPEAPAPAPADVQLNTGSATIDIGLPSQQSDVGLETSDSPFYKPLGADALQTGTTAPAADQEQPAATDDEDSAQISDLEDEPDDTVKSINDALRGLFR
ncbi:MAG TPA: hypothetical protein V6C76_13540 [Drouetiella sp.]